MELLKKVISLDQAAQISGYNQDYLGSLIRKGEIKGVKKARVWFTTEEEIKNYIFKKKVQHQEFAIGDFFSHTRIKNIIIATIIIFFAVFLITSYFNNKNFILKEEIKTSINSDQEELIMNNQ